MAKPKSAKAMTDISVEGKNMKQLTEMMRDPAVPKKLKDAAKRRLDVLSNQDTTKPLGMNKGGKATKKVPVISIGVGMAEMPKGKAKMMRGGMSGGKEHMYAAGGMVKDNPGLKALKAASPEAYKKITGK
jgi:hypothetical protein